MAARGSILLGAALLAGAVSGTGPARAQGVVGPPEAPSAPTWGPRPVTVGAIAALAQAVGWPVVVDATRQALRIPIGGENIDFDVFIQPAQGTDSRGVQLVTFAVPQVAVVPRSHVDLDEVLQTLMRMNWFRVIGHWSWDRQDGEVRFEYVFMTADPIAPGEFVGIVERVATSVDDDAPRIFKALGLPDTPSTTTGLAIEAGLPAGQAPARQRLKPPPRPAERPREDRRDRDDDVPAD